MTVRTFVSSVVSCALLCTLLLAWRFGQPSGAELIACAFMLLIAAASHSIKYKTTSNAGGAVSLIPFLAIVILCPTWAAPPAIAFAVSVGELRASRDWIKKLFNVGQFALATATAILVFRSLGGESPVSVPTFEWTLVLPLGAASVAFVLVNKLAVASVIGISEQKDAWDVWRRLVDTAIIYDLVSMPLAYGYARVYTDLGVIWALLLTLPLLGIRQLYRANWQLQRSSEELLQLIVNAIEARDPYTSGHSRRVAHFATIVAQSIGLNMKAIDRIFTAAILHDVGKIHEDFAPILRKPTTLTPEERAIIESHSERGALLVSTVSQLEDIVPVVRHHHERWDGRGYPSQLAGQAIPLGSRIIMLADTIDAMTSDRPYRPALSKDVVLAELDRMSGIQFDPDITRKFLGGNGPAELFAAVDAYHASETPERDVTRLLDRTRRIRIA